MLVATLLGSIAAAQPGADVVRAQGDITVDGVLDEADWARARPVSTFTRYIPTDGGPPPGDTEIRFLQDARHLYVGVRVTGLDYPLRARISPREAINSDDQIGVYLDTFRDRQSGYIFYHNPLGIQQDARYNAGSWNATWDTVFRSAGRITEGGFELELALPYRSLKYPTGPGRQEWGVILTRKVPHLGAKYSWPAIERGHPRLFAQALPLRGVEPPPRGSGLDLIGAATAVQAGTRDTTVPLEWTGLEPWHQVVRPSLDARLGITPNIGLVAAVNPDFSQIEGDVTPIDLNLRFEPWFPEQRPFFLEGAGYLDDSANTLYTRSVVEPAYGVKVTGQEGPWAVGAVHALDRHPTASVHEDGAPGFDEADVDGAWASNTVGRVRMEALDGGWVGLTLADKHLFAPGEGVRGSHQVIATDLDFDLGNRWTTSGSLMQSFTADSEGQRLWGQETRASVGRSAGKGTGMRLTWLERTPGVRKEAGFMNQSGFDTVELWVNHTMESDGLVDRYVPRLVLYGSEQRDGDRYRSLGTRQAVVLRGVHEMVAWGGLTDQTQDGSRVRGWYTGGSYAGTFGQALALVPSISTSRALDWDTLEAAQVSTASLGTTLRPTTGLRLDTLLRLQHLDPESAAPEQATLVRTKLAWQFTRELGVRLIAEHARRDGDEDLLTSSALITWLHHPGTAAYLGYAETQQLGEDRGVLDRSVFAKVTVLVRP